LKQFNTPKKYEYILSNAGTDNILYADEKYDITTEIIEYLNARYVKK
jgi:outer membrane protein